jgi:hypothetical protein
MFAWGYIPPEHAGDGHTLDAGYGPADADAVLAAAIDAAVGPEAAAGIERRVVGDLAPKSPARRRISEGAGTVRSRSAKSA